MKLQQLNDSQLASLLAGVKLETERRTKAAAAGADAAKIIKSHEMGKRAALIAAAGGHSILFVGPPGCGKTLLRAMLLELGHSASFEAHPCPCGYKNDPLAECKCTVKDCERHLRKLPRAEIYIEVPRVPSRELDIKSTGTGLDYMREKIAGMTPAFVPELFDDGCQRMLKSAVVELGVTAEVRETILNVAVTIARLEQATRIELPHLCEALNYRIPLHNLRREVVT